MRNTTEGRKPEGKILHAGTRHRWEDNIKLDSKHERHISRWVDKKSVVDTATPHSSGLQIQYYTNLLSLYVYRMNTVHVTTSKSNLVFTSTVRLD